jgi:SGNH hydrolase-like domain, acetyltransferase AlgX
MAFRLRYTLPSILLTTLLIDQTTRALPIDRWSFRAWEAMSVDHAPSVPFEPSRRYKSSRSYGDLANLGNLRRLRVYRHERFTTDAYGFRNPPGLADSGITSVLLLGDSMAVGSGVPDESTLSAQLTSDFRRRTYTIAPALPTAATLAAFIRMLGLKKGDWVVNQVTYLYNESAAWSVEPRRYPPVTLAERWWRSYQRDLWPLRILANQVTRFVQDDRLLSNPFKSNVRIARLQNGDEMIFLASDVYSPGVPEQTRKDVSDSVRYLRSLADVAEKHSLRWLVVLVPTKLAVYMPLIAGVRVAPLMPGSFAELESQLHGAGLSVINLYPPLASQAQVEAAQHKYLYWRDDTHWNAEGIAAAAQAIARFMSEQERSEGR